MKSLARRALSNFYGVCIVVSLTSVLSACGGSSNGNRDRNLDTIVPVLETEDGSRLSGSSSRLQVKQGELALLFVDIAGYVQTDRNTGVTESTTLPADITVAGYNINFPEAEALIDITVESCVGGVGTASCQEWTIAPSPSAIPGLYEIEIQPAGSDTLVNIRTETLYLNVEANIALTSAPAAVAIYGNNSSGGVISVRTRDNERWAWGSNEGSFDSGYVGIGYFLEDAIGGRGSVEPSRVNIAALDADAGVKFVDLAIHSNSPSLGLTEFGAVWAWGGREQGLGILRTDSQPPIFLPSFVSSFSNVSHIAVANSAVDTYTPFPTVVRTGVVCGQIGCDVNLISAQSFAIINGEIHYWGSLTDKLSFEEPLSGIVESQVSNETPQVMTGVEKVVGGRGFALALKDDGTVWSWGSNGLGQLGYATTRNRDFQETDDESTVARRIPSLSNITQIFGGDRASFAIDESGATYFWGRDNRGNLGLPLQTGSIISQFTDVPLRLGGWGGNSVGENEAVDIANYDFGSGAIIAAPANSGSPDDGGQVWIWTNNEPFVFVDVPGIIRLPGLSATDVDSGYAVDKECGVTTTPDGNTTDSGFVWDISRYPARPPELLPIFGKYDPSCPNRLFVDTVGQGSVGVSPQGTDQRPADCEMDICRSSYAYGSSTLVQITAVPAAGWALDPSRPWSGSDECDNASTESLSVTVQGGTQCVAHFVDTSTVVDYTVLLTGNGRITDASGQIDCPGSCSGRFQIGSTIMLTLLADAGWEYQGDCEQSTTVSASGFCTAAFTEVAGPGAVLTLTISGGPGAGEVQSNDGPPPTMDCVNSDTAETVCMATFNSGTTVELIPNAFGTNSAVQWTGCDTSSGIEGCTLTMSADRSVTAAFTSSTANNSPPVALFTVAPNSGITTSTNVVFDGSGSTDADGSIVTYEWDFDGDKVTDATGVTAQNVFTSAGAYSVTLTVTDDGGQVASSVTTIQVVAPLSAAPMASFTVTPAGQTVLGTPLTLDASASTDDVGIDSFEWDFDNDGSIDATGEVVAFTPSVLGQTQVRLRVTDADGQFDESVQTVTVIAGTATTFTLRVVIDGAGSVDIAQLAIVFPNSNCDGNECFVFGITAGSVLTLSAFATAPAVFQGWNSTECDEIQVDLCRFTMTSNRSVTATFR